MTANQSTIVERLEKLASSPAVTPLLAPAAFFYGAGNYLRILSFKYGLSGRSRAAVPVISIGNVTVGGTGKTPVVIDLAKRLCASGLKVAILSRGYGRKSKDASVVVCNGNGPQVSVEDSGDEPFLIAASVPQCILIVASKRKDSAAMAVEKFGAQIILLDDGYQHWQLQRDQDIVLFDYNDDPEVLALLPKGRLREPLAALGRASAIVVTKIPLAPQSGSDQAFNPDADAKEVQKRLARLNETFKRLAPQAVVGYSSFAPGVLLPKNVRKSEILRNSDKTPRPNQLKDTKILALCAIARPENFIDSLGALNADIVDKAIYPDHHWFTAEDRAEIEERFKKSGAQYIITSEKDMVRLNLSDALNNCTYALQIEPIWFDTDGKVVDRPPYLNAVLSMLQKEPAAGGVNG